jgi:hypothetical protein
MNCHKLLEIFGGETNLIGKIVHWLRWDKMTRPKIQGGIGFRDLRIFNQALLAKQAWRLLEHPENLCARLLKAKYYPAGELLDIVFPKNESKTWQGTTHGLELLKHGIDKRYFMYIPLICIPLYIPLYLYHLPIYKERPALLGAVQYPTYNSVMVSELAIGSNASA